MIKVSHEAPLCLLSDSRLFNDYDYCLPHLMDEEPGYEEYFMGNPKKQNDTSLWTTRFTS
jgi:hypothetical protein